MGSEWCRKKLRISIDVKYGSQKSFAKAIGMSTTQLSQYLVGVRSPGLKVLQKFQRGGININWLLDDELNAKDFELYLEVEKVFRRIKGLKK